MRDVLGYPERVTLYARMVRACSKAMKMNRILTLAATGLMTLACTTAASAADLPRRTPATAFAPAPAFSWTGFYAGANVGYHALSGRTMDFSATESAAGGFATGLRDGAIPARLATRGGAFLGGLQLGYNYQINQFVVGVEADLNYTNANSRVSFLSRAGGDITTTTVEREMSYLGTVRARAGVAFDRLFVYATGGLAYANTRNGFRVDEATTPFSVSASSRATYGWTVGGGAEYALTNNWTVKGEYLFYNLGSSDPGVLVTAGGIRSTLVGSVNNQGHIGKLGVNYKF